MGHFCSQYKSATAYLDLAANAHGEEKGALMLRALARTSSERARVVEIDPGGGAAVVFLVEQLCGQQTHERRELTARDVSGHHRPGTRRRCVRAYSR